MSTLKLQKKRMKSPTHNVDIGQLPEFVRIRIFEIL